MNDRFVRWLATILTISACTSALVRHWPHAESVVPDDLDHDGRPDIWRVYDVNHHLAEVIRDTNRDGQGDVREYYDEGAVVHRESDRDFNNQIDLVEDFDAASGRRSRSVIDLDSDGIADVLVLFQGQDAVFVKAAPLRASTSTARSARARAETNVLLPLEDPFGADLSVRPAHSPERLREFVGLATAGGIPLTRHTTAALPFPSALISPSRVLPADAADAQPGSPRGPPPTFHLIRSLQLS